MYTNLFESLIGDTRWRFAISQWLDVISSIGRAFAAGTGTFRYQTIQRFKRSHPKGKKLPVAHDDRQKGGLLALQNADNDHQSDDNGDWSQDDNESNRSSH